MRSAREVTENFENEYYDDADFTAVGVRGLGKGKFGKTERRKKDGKASKTMTTLAQLEKRSKNSK